MNEITGQVFSVAKENRPVAGCTISKEVFSNGEDYILYFSLAKDTDISAEIYDYQKLIKYLHHLIIQMLLKVL